MGCKATLPQPGSLARDMAATGKTVIAGVRLMDQPGPFDIEIVGGAISAARPSGEPVAGSDVIDGRDRLAVAGFVNGLQHSHELYFRGMSERLPLEEWMLSVRPVEPLPLAPEDVYWRTLAVAAEALRTGTTTICDDVGIDPAGQPELLAAVVEAYADAGIRALVGPTLFDVPFARAVPFAQEELPTEVLAAMEQAAARGPDAATRLAAFRRFAGDRQQCGEIVQAIAAPSAPQRCSPDFLMSIRAIADELLIPVMTHVLETRVQAVGAQVGFGKTMVAHLDALGFLKPRTSLIHGVWLSRDDMQRIARSGATVQHNPWSNLKLGSGVAAVRALLDAGVNVSLGSDGCGSIETASLQPTIAAAALLSTLRGAPVQWLSSREAYEAATLGGARALGLEEKIGRIAPGYRADIVLHRLDRAPFQPLNDAVRQLVFGDAAAAVDSVMVDGRLVMQKGRLTSIDEDALQEGLTAAHARLKPHLDAARAAAQALQPALRRIGCRCNAIPLAGDYPPALLEPRP